MLQCTGRVALTLLLVATAIGTPSAISAQQAQRVFPVQAGLSNPPNERGKIRGEFGRHANDPPQTHWLKGGIIGGVILGAAMSTLIAGLNNSSDGSEVTSGGRAGLFVGFGVIGFGIGALIGGQFKK